MKVRLIQVQERYSLVSRRLRLWSTDVAQNGRVGAVAEEVTGREVTIVWTRADP